MTKPAKERQASTAEERYRIEERCEEAMNQLLAELAELRNLDGRQRQEAGNAGLLASEGVKISDFGNLVRPWLSSRLGGPDGYLRTPRYIGADKPLTELDHHSRKPE